MWDGRQFYWTNMQYIFELNAGNKYLLIKGTENNYERNPLILKLYLCLVTASICLCQSLYNFLMVIYFQCYLLAFTENILN